MRILIVENHSDTATYLRIYLEGLGHSVALSSTLAEARPLLAAEDFDVLISDIFLPDGEGWQLMEERPEDSIYAIAISGLSGSGDLSRSAQAGFRHHLTKPFLPAEFDRVLAEAEAHLAKR